jgi:hypothetical protein
MEINELRIGNYVKHYDPINGTNIYKVYNIDDRGGISRVSLEGKGQLASCTVKDIEPIELTEEVLLKLGFYKKSIGNELYRYYKEVCIDNYSYLFDYAVIPKDKYIGLKVTKAENEDDEVDYFTIFYNDNIKNLHQLQNAYFILTDKELKIEL